MYAIADDAYCYAGTTVLKNRAGLREQAALTRFEAAMTLQRFEEPLPAGGLGLRHYRAIHRHIFQDVYRWAGSFRSVRMGKGRSMFCYPEHIADQMRGLFATLKRDRFLTGLDDRAFAGKAARFLATLNAIHPFRDGNGRAQTAFLLLVAQRAGHPADIARLDPDAFRTAMIESFAGSEEPLCRQILALIV